MEENQELRFVSDKCKNGMPIFGILNTQIKFSLCDPALKGQGPWTSLNITAYGARDTTYFNKWTFKSALKRCIDEKLLKHIVDIFKKYVVHGQINEVDLKKIQGEFSKPYILKVKKKSVKRKKK